MKTFEQVYKEILNNGKSYENQLDKVELDIKNNNEKIIVFGYGKLGKTYLDFLNKHDLMQNVICVIDNFKQGKDLKYNIEVLKPENISTDVYQISKIFIATLFPEIKDVVIEQIVKLGANKENIFDYYTSSFKPYMLKCSQRDFEKNHYAGYERAYDLVVDQSSKDIIVQRINSYFYETRLSHSQYHLQYFDPEVIKFTKDEVFVDGGSFNGQNAKDFVDIVNNDYIHIYSFEPDNKNFQYTSEALKNFKNVTVINSALYHKKDTLFFDETNNGGSHIENNIENNIENKNLIKVEAVALDDFFKDKQPPTFIKMDIEGAELSALKGLENTIKQNSPKLAICAYHKIEDIYELLDIIKSYGNYDFYFRHYTPLQLETVLYAIPK